jgi:hypothetical protein
MTPPSYRKKDTKYRLKRTVLTLARTSSQGSGSTLGSDKFEAEIRNKCLAPRRFQIHLEVATRRPGANLNALLDENLRDPLSGNAVLSGVPVRLEPENA